MSGPDSPAGWTNGHDLPVEILDAIEVRYWAPIESGAQPERFMYDSTLFDAPAHHPALFSDHGVVHVRDVARTSAELVDALHGWLIDERNGERLAFVRNLTVLLAYLHDIGMVASTPEGRKVHPQFAAQVAVGPDFDDLASALWEADAGRIRSRLDEVSDAQPGLIIPYLVFRELLALSLCHSKTAVPAPLLDDHLALRRLMIRGTFTPLSTQASAPKGSLKDLAWTPDDTTETARSYRDVESDAFAWLDHPEPAIRDLRHDAIDAVRVLRAADALRQRGTALYTSGGFEICAELKTGRALYALRSRDHKHAAVLSVENPISAAESNFRYATLDRNATMRVAFYRAFGTSVPEQARHAFVAATAHVIADIEADVVSSFRAAPAGSQRSVNTRRIELVALEGDTTFVESVTRYTRERFPHLAERIDLVPPDPRSGAVSDTSWITDVVRLSNTSTRAEELLTNMEGRGLNVSRIDIEQAVADAVVVRVQRGTELLQPHTVATVVLVPMSEGLVVHPTARFERQPLHPWLPVGVTGVVRGGERNAAVVAETELDVVVIPAESYLQHWFRPYELDEFRKVVEVWSRPGSSEQRLDLSNVEPVR